MIQLDSSTQPDDPIEAASGGEIPEDLKHELRAAWHRYIDLTPPLRPALHGDCRRLTHDLWDAEDLVPDTLLRAYAFCPETMRVVADALGLKLRTGLYRFPTPELGVTYKRTE